MIPQENKLLALLSNNDVTFFIPPYQRNYEWTEEQCKVFYDDVVKTCEKNIAGASTEHFFGSITYFQEDTPFGQPNKLVLIDGQQRVTTTMLFLVALRDIISDDVLKNYIDNKYLKNMNVSGDSEYKIKLKQVETDWKAYRNIILSENIDEVEKNSSVYRNYQYFKNKLTEYSCKGNDLNSLIQRGIDKFSVITIELQPQKNEWENPQEIFESMNSLGKPLSLADLVRNYLFLGMNAETQTSLYNKYWLHIEKILPHITSDFIRDFMQGKMKRAYLKATESNYKVLYSTFKNIFDTVDSVELLKELYEYAEIYKCVVLEVSTGNSQVDRCLDDIRHANVTTAYSFLMMLLYEWKNNSFSDKDILEILDVFRTFCYRRRIIALTQSENTAFPALADRIPDLISSVDKKQKMFDILANQDNRMRLPNDIEIARTLETLNFYNFRYCKFILALVEEKMTKSIPDLSDKKLQIEHIMPRKLSDEWIIQLGDQYEDIHQELLNTIGNLTLIRHNQELGNKAFADKKEVYENNAGLQIARTNITNKGEWNKEAILNRANWIIDYILKEVFPIPEKMRKTNNYAIKEGHGLSFQELQLVGQDIYFWLDNSIIAKVVSDKEVEFEGKKWRLSPLTREIQTRRGALNNSGTYSGAQFWGYDGIRLADIL